MSVKKMIFVSLILLLSLNDHIIAEIKVDPNGFAVAVGNDVGEIELVLSNSRDEEVQFNVDYRLVDVNNERNAGPRRDDLGDIINEFNVRIGGINEQKVGVSWDFENEWMWRSNNPNSAVYAIDPNDDFNIVREINIQTPFNVACLYGQLYVVNNALNSIFHYDTEGNNLGEINLGYNVGAITRSEELGLLFIMNDPDRAFHVFTIDEDGLPDEELGVIPNLGQWCNDVASYRSCDWVDAHPNGQFWVANSNPDGQGANLYQFLIDTEEWDVVEVVSQTLIFEESAQNRQRMGVGHDGENLWTTSYNSGVLRIMDDGIVEFGMLTLDPEEGIIPGNDLASINISIDPIGYEDGVYDILIGISLEDPNEDIELSAVVTIGEAPTYNLTGAVTDAETEEVIEGVSIEMDRYSISRNTNERGVYSILELPTGVYTYTFSAPDYLPGIHEINIDEAGDIELNVELLHAECNPAPAEIRTELAPDSDAQIAIEISNDGNGPLTYVVERQLPGDANADPWDLRQSMMFGQDRDDSRIQGVVFANDNFYVSAAHNYEPAIYIFNRDGEYVDMFLEPGDDRYGMKDMAFDGELIWGVIGSTMYALALNGDIQIEFECPVRSVVNAAYDHENDWVWVSAITTDIVALDREGNQQALIERGDIRIYGLAYYPDDPDDHPVYIYAKESETNRSMVYKANPEDGDISFVTYLDHEGGGAPLGIYTTNQFDPYSWVLMAVANSVPNEGGDRVDLWQIDARKDWAQIEPTDGMIEAGEAQEFELTLDATDLPVGEFEIDIVYIHDGVGGETTIPVALGVVDGPAQSLRTLQLDMGWSLISVNLQPDPDDIIELMSELVDAELLLMLKDGMGRFYSPAFGFCNIPGWNVTEGYQIKMEDAGELTMGGITVMSDDPIPLHEGWNMASYFPRQPVDAIVALSGIVDQLFIAKDGSGNFYSTQWGFSNLGNMQELWGYQIKVSEDVDLVYRLQEQDEEVAARHPRQRGELPEHPNTGNNMSLLIQAGTLTDCEIGVYANDKLVGAGVVVDGVCGIAVWGDDATTPEVDGALVDESLELRIFVDGESKGVQFKTQSGEGLFKTDGFWVVELLSNSEIPQEFGIVSVFPNPFNSTTRIDYALPFESYISLNLYSLSGQRVETLFNGKHRAGVHCITLNAEDMASGLYFIKLESSKRSVSKKVLLVK
ncbi:MAG: T9SS type A sorting domain-containing protein [Calditrichaeota bacterium]|nr:T9SS type A sorting domain-containing protein [Calditrichota bacterium]